MEGGDHPAVAPNPARFDPQVLRLLRGPRRRWRRRGPSDSGLLRGVRGTEARAAPRAPASRQRYNDCFLCLKDVAASNEILRKENLELAFLIENLEKENQPPAMAVTRSPSEEKGTMRKKWEKDLLESLGGLGSGSDKSRGGGVPNSISIRTSGFLAVKDPPAGGAHRIRLPACPVLSVCPVCAARVEMDMVAHITMQHGNFFKMQRRRRFRRGSCRSHSTLSLLRKELREGNHLQALLGGSTYTIAPPSNAASDPLLSSLIYSLAVADSSRDVQPDSLGEDSLVSKTSDVKVVERKERSPYKLVGI